LSPFGVIVAAVAAVAAVVLVAPATVALAALSPSLSSSPRSLPLMLA